MSDATAARQLLADLYKEHALVRLVDGQLRIKARPGVITDERREIIQTNKAEIVAMLRTHACTKCNRGAFPTPDVICFRCRNAKPDTEAA